MNLIDLAKQLGIFQQTRGDSGPRPMIDMLESRSLLSASPAVVGSDGLGGSTVPVVTLALKGSVTSIKVYSALSTPGEAVKIVANVKGRTSTAIPTGTITFKTGATVLATVALNASGVAKLITTALPTGLSQITAVYSGSGRFATSTSAVVAHNVQGSTSTVKLSVSSIAPSFGDTVNLAARVGVVGAFGSQGPSGRVTFYDGTKILGSHTLNSVGVARIAAPYLYVGAHGLKAVYSGSPAVVGHRSAVRTVTVATPAVSTGSDGLQVGTIVPGHGVSAAAGDNLTLHYTLYLASTGEKLESSHDSGQPFTFTLGANQVIAGFDEGLVGTRAGERRVLVIPPALGYGSHSSPSGDVPPNSTIVFVLDVVSIQQHA